MKGLITALLVVAGLGAVGWKVYWKLPGKDAEAGKVAAAVPVEVADVRQATIREIGQFVGDLMARSEFVVAPKVAGRLVRLHKDIGDTVTNGDVIAELDDDEYKQQVEQAKAEWEVARAAVDEARSILDTAQREYDRVQALRGQKIASESELDEALSQYRTAQSRHKVALLQVAHKEAALKTAEVRQAYTRITATWSGGGDSRMIGERYADTGAMLAANDRIVSVVDIDELTAVIHVSENQYAKVQVNHDVIVTCIAYPGRPFAGKVVRIAPLVKQTSRQARVEIQVSNAERLLRPGMFIEARIELDRHENATVVPEAALVRGSDGRSGLFLADLKGRRARFVPATAGLSEGSLVEILEPPLRGQVVTLGQHLLEDNTPILVAGEVAAEGASSATRPATARAGKTAAGAKS